MQRRSAGRWLWRLARKSAASGERAGINADAAASPPTCESKGHVVRCLPPQPRRRACRTPASPAPTRSSCSTTDRSTRSSSPAACASSGCTRSSSPATSTWCVRASSSTRASLSSWRVRRRRRARPATRLRARAPARAAAVTNRPSRRSKKRRGHLSPVETPPAACPRSRPPPSRVPIAPNRDRSASPTRTRPW